MSRGCNQFTYLTNADVPVCTSSAPGGLVPLLSFRDDNVRFRASLDASLAVANVELNGSIAITSKAGYCLHLAGGQIKSFNFTTVFDYSADISANLSITAQYDNLNKPFVLAGPFQTAPLLAGPIIIVPTVTPVLMVNATATAALSGAISYNSEVTSSLTFTASTSKWNNTSSTICKPDPISGQVATLSTLCLQPRSTTMSVLGSVKVALGLQFSLLLYDIAGPVVTPDVYLRLDGGYSTSGATKGPSCDKISEGTQPGSWGGLCAGLEVAVGAQLNPLLGFLLPTTNWTVATFDLGSALLGASVTANPSPNVTLQADGTFKLNPGESTTITTTVAGTILPTSLSAFSSWNPGWVAPTCGTLAQTSPGIFLFTAPFSGRVCTVEFTKSFLGLNIWTKASLSFRTSVPPSSPQGLTAELQSGHILVQWMSSASDGGAPITTYKLYRGTISGSETLIQTLGAGLSFSDASLVCQTTYFYKVSAVNLAGEGSQSAEAQASVICTASVPQSLATTESANGIVLSWQAPASSGGSTVTGYVIYRGQSSSQESFLVRLGPVTTYTDSSVSSGITYYYKVAAINGAGTGAPSDAAAINFAPPLSSPTPTPSPSPSPSPSSPSPNAGSSFSGIVLYVALGAVIALLGVVTVLLLSRRKSKV